MHLDNTEQAKQRRKPRDRESAQLQEPAVNLVDRCIALQRRNAVWVIPSFRSFLALTSSPHFSATRPEDRTERIPSPTMNRPSERSLSTIRSASSTRVPPMSPHRPTPHHHPQGIFLRPAADPDDSSRRLKISTSTSPCTSPKHAAKLFNPDTDPISIRHTNKSETIFEAESNYIHRNASSPTSRHVPTRQLFDRPKYFL
jgi:hypothetical protein